MGWSEFLWFTEPNHRCCEHMHAKLQIVAATDLTTGIGPGLMDPGQVMVHIVANVSQSRTLGTEYLLLCWKLGLWGKTRRSKRNRRITVEAGVGGNYRKQQLGQFMKIPSKQVVMKSWKLKSKEKLDQTPINRVRGIRGTVLKKTNHRDVSSGND